MRGHCLVGSLTGVVASKSVTEASKGALRTIGNRPQSVSLPVKGPYAITLYRRLPIGVRAPLEASVTLLEATTPVKLPTKQCPRISELELK